MAQMPSITTPICIPMAQRHTKQSQLRQQTSSGKAPSSSPQILCFRLRNKQLQYTMIHSNIFHLKGCDDMTIIHTEVDPISCNQVNKSQGHSSTRPYPLLLSPDWQFCVSRAFSCLATFFPVQTLLIAINLDPT